MTKPLLGVRDPLPETLGQGETITMRLKILGIPANRHTLHLKEVDDATRTIRTNEHGGSLKTWNHTIQIEPTSDATCRYTDVVEFNAGALTPIAYPISERLLRLPAAALAEASPPGGRAGLCDSCRFRS